MDNSLIRSSVMHVRPEWIDYNGHMNMAYYAVLFDEAADEIYPFLGFGPEYRKTGFTTYTGEFHIRYLRELHEDDKVTVTLQLVEFDEKRFHTFQEIIHEDGWCAASGEAMTLHIDQSGPRVAPMPAATLEKLRQLASRQARLSRPENAGRGIGIRRRI